MEVVLKGKYLTCLCLQNGDRFEEINQSDLSLKGCLSLELANLHDNHYVIQIFTLTKITYKWSYIIFVYK